MAAAKNISANEVRRMVDLGIPISKVARKLGVSRFTIYYHLGKIKQRVKTRKNNDA
jgi:DNA invertase Pin-like site-specific DNA recombinase